MLFATLRIFVWKHYKTLRLNWMTTLVNTALPIGLCFLAIYVMNASMPPTTTNAEGGEFGSLPPLTDVNSLGAKTAARHDVIRQDDLDVPFVRIVYAPRNNLTDRIVDAVRMALQLQSDRVRPFDTVAQLTNYTRDNMTAVEAAIEFQTPGPQLAAVFRYALKLPDSVDFAVGDSYARANYFDAATQSYDPYLYSGFAALQTVIDRTVLQLRHADNNAPIVRLDIGYQKLPSLIVALPRANFEPIMKFAMLVYLFALVNMLLTPTVEEKQLGIREFLRIATSYAQLNLLTFAVLNAAIGVAIFMSIVLFGHAYGMTGHFSLGCAAVLVVLAVMAFVAFTVLISVAFQTVFYAKNTGLLLFLVPLSSTMYPPIARLVPFVSVLALFDAGWDLMDEYGNRAMVFGWANLTERSPTSAVPYSMLDIWLYLIFDTVAYSLLYTYLIQVFPGAYGTPRPYYWPLQRLIELLTGRRAASVDRPDAASRRDDDGAEMPGRNVVVRVRGLCKEFGQWFGETTRAVHNVSMDICANQITVLLGHNGAGKTTAMSMISGIIPKTSGDISVNGERNVHLYRKKIGYCPQHNVILPYFTCLDHLLFFGGLRGLSAGEARAQGQRLLDRLRLGAKAHEYGRDLSGGMRRRLCLGNALIGDTNIAILDEPSSGLDPESRRELWNILLEMRKSNTILITTHYMEEAETLADYISIMSRGEILCHGKAQQLKRRYASGYVLKLLLTDPHQDTERLVGRIRQRIAGAHVKSFVRPTLCVTLPYSHISMYPETLRDLEQASAELGIESISMSNASLEDVFLNCDPEKHVPDAPDANSQTTTTTTGGGDQVDSTSYSPLNESSFQQRCSLRAQQTLAVWYKKCIFVRCHWPRLAIGVALLLCALYWGGIRTSAEEAPGAGPATPPPPAPAIVPPGEQLSRTFDSDHLPAAGGNVLLYIPRSLATTSYGMAFRRSLERIIGQAPKGQRLTIVPLPDDVDLHLALLRLERTNMMAYFERTVCAFALDSTATAADVQLNIMYSASVLHSVPRCTNLAHNIWSQMIDVVAADPAQPSGQQQHLIVTNEPQAVRWNSPFASSNNAHRDAASEQSADQYLMLMPLALFFYMMFYVYMPFVETSTEFKQLQIVAAPVYWLAYYAFDVLQHALVCALLFGAHVLFDRGHMFTVAEHAQLVCMYLMYGMAYLPLLYVVAQAFGSLSTVYSVCSYMFAGTAVPAILFSAAPAMLVKYAPWVALLSVFPDYSLRQALNVFVYSHRPGPSAADWPADGRRFYAYMGGVLVGCMALLVLVLEHIYRRDVLVRVLHSYRPLWRRFCRRRKAAGADGEQSARLTTRKVQAVDDERALTESVVRANRMQDFAIVVSGLRKRYDDGFEAVRGLDFTVSRGQCFGLLGMNGAGKTTTFRMMARDVPVSAGEIHLNGLASRAHPTRYRFALGYCPQTDALCGWMTAFETLKYMGMSRGIRLAELDEDVRRLLRNTDLLDYADVAARKYSGGTKRKLNTAMAMQTDPFLVCLDEPTTGVDPASRRFMWACIQECQRQHKNIVLTSHSMDECEFLCNRLAIMNHGQLNCIGPIQKLKQEFRLGYVMTVLVREGRAGSDGVEQMKQHVLEQFEFVLREEYGNQLCFVAQDCNATWSKVFEKMIDLQKTHADVIEDVTLSESSLEDIFLKIARESFTETPQAV